VYLPEGKLQRFPEEASVPALIFGVVG